MKRMPVFRLWMTGSITWLFILLWIYAATSKLLDFGQFRVQVGQSPLLTPWANRIAVTVPAVEVMIAVLLLTDRWRLAGLYASFGLMTSFTAYIVTITRFSEYVPCSCGGILEKMTWNDHLVFNMIMTVLAAVACTGQTYALQPSGETENLLRE